MGNEAKDQEKQIPLHQRQRDEGGGKPWALRDVLLVQVLQRRLRFPTRTSVAVPMWTLRIPLLAQTLRQRPPWTEEPRDGQRGATGQAFWDFSLQHALRERPTRRRRCH